MSDAEEVPSGPMSTADLPESIGPYRMLRPIARGGMAEVYEVEDPISGEHLALKLLMQGGPARARFDREYEALIRLNHPNIVRVYSYGVALDRPWLSMELIDGTPVQAYAKHCGRPGSDERNGEVTRIAHDLALALDHIHRRGLVHRDLKSANVLVLPDGRVKLLDFGTAKVSRALAQITRDGEFIGTFAYASPEQLTGAPVDHRSDLYSLGVLLYRLATGKRPFMAKELHELARMQVKAPPTPPRAIVDSIPQGLEDVILGLLEKRPEDRPTSGEAVAAALEAVVGHPLYLPGTLDVDLSSERLVGREVQMAALWRFVEGGGQGNGHAPGCHPGDVALVVGLQGSGRHRVLQTLEKDIAARQWRSVSAFFRRGREDLDVLVEMFLKLGDHFAGKPKSVEAALAGLVEVQESRILSVAERLDRVRAAANTLLTVLTRSSRSPVVVVLRGMQHMGPIGYELLVALRETVQEGNLPVLLLGDITERADDPSTMARKRLPDALRVHLPPMTVREVALLVGSLLHRRPPPAMIARQIYDASGGLPTYVEEVVKSMVAQGILRVRGRDANRIEWAQKEDLEIPVPEGARMRVMDSLAELPADRRRLLEALAVAGGEGSDTVLAAALGKTPRQLDLAFDDLASRGWISLERQGESAYARWRQILAEQVVLDQLHPCRLRVLERRIIDQVASEPAFVAQIKLLLEVGRVDEALERALDWSVHHLSRNRPVTALQVLDVVIPRVMEGDNTPNTTRSQLLLLHTTALLMARPTDPQTARSLAQANTLGKHEGDVFQAEIDLTRARIQRVIGHYPNFRKFLMKAWNVVEHMEPSPLGMTVADLLGWSNRVAGLVDDAAAWHGRARRIAVQVGIPGVLAHADVGVAGWQYARGLLQEAERTVVSAIKVFDEVGDTRGISLALPVWADALRQQGRFTEVLGVLYQQTPVMRESEAPSFYVRVMLAAALCENDLCRLGRAQECVEELAATLRKGEHLDLRLMADLVTGRIQDASGELTEARHTLGHVVERAGAAGLHVLAQRARVQLASVEWQLGDVRGARKQFTDAVNLLRKSGDVPATVEAVVVQSRVMAEVLDPERIYEPVTEFLDVQPAPIARLERELARARYKIAQRDDPAVPIAAAASILERVAAGLSDTDRAALRLHPWAQLVREQGHTVMLDDGVP
jgi:tetratricopeptide (TPR) repeat protein